MKKIWTKISIALLIALAGMGVVVVGRCLYDTGRPGEFFTVYWMWFLFVGIVSLLGGVYTSGQVGKRILELDLLCATLITAPAFLSVVHVLRFRDANAEAVVMLGAVGTSGLYYLARCLTIFVLAGRRLFPGRDRDMGSRRNGYRLLAAGVLLFCVPGYIVGGGLYTRIQRAHMERAMSEVRHLDLAFGKLLSDASVARVPELLQDPGLVSGSSVEDTIERDTKLAYTLLSYGRNADVGLTEHAKHRLGTSYVSLKNDPWGNPYRFYFGPLEKHANKNAVLRSRRTAWKDAAGVLHAPYVYDMATYEHEQSLSNGRPVPEPDASPVAGYPCPTDLPVYIFSCGQNRKPDQARRGGDGGDDINNWDSRDGWRGLY